MRWSGGWADCIRSGGSFSRRPEVPSRSDGLEGPVNQRPFEARASRGHLRVTGKACAPFTDSIVKQPAFADASAGKPTLRRPYSLIGAGYAAVAKSNSSLPRGERSAGRRGGVRDPRWMAGETIRWDALRRRPLAPLGTRRLPALHSGVLRLTGRAFENVDQPRLSASSWRQVLMPASGAPPSPECQRLRSPPARGAASADGGVSPLGRPGEIRPYLRPSPHRCSVFTASHDDAPRRAGQDDNPHSEGCVNSPM